MKKNGFVQILIPIIIVMALAIGGWYLFTTQKIQLKNTPQATSSSNLKEYVTKGFLIKADFPKYKFSYPVGWEVSEDTKAYLFDNVSISKNGYQIHIDQEIRTGAGACYFNDSPTGYELGPGADLQTVTYVEMNSNIGRLRYFRWLSEEGVPENSYGFCAKDEVRSKELGRNVYGVPSVGFLTMDVPSVQDTAIFQEALNIIKSITPQ